MNQYRIEMDDNNLGLEHIFREIGKIYEHFASKSIENNPYLNAPKLYAELLIAGHSIELLDGDSSSITGSWLSAICENVNRIKPKMRIFVISILGLQSSGKSTLLNALFGCKFAVSVGRCTRGLFMRLLFLDENLKKDLNIDAILLIDSEGLEALEKINEENANKKDRSMATLAMGISHLTIVNVRGENMGSLTEILQIALIAMTRLKIANISPDILIVQHLDELNNEKLATGRIGFNEALRNAFTIIDEKFLDLGVRDSGCLDKLSRTIKSKEFFKYFHPFKNGSSVNSPPSEDYHKDIVKLFNSILNIAKNSSRITDFEQWPVMVQNFWEAVKTEDFMSFKDVMGIYEFLKNDELISKVKESVESAYSKHHDELHSFVADKAMYLIENDMNSGHVFNELKNKLDFVLEKCPQQKCDECQKFSADKKEFYEYVEKKGNKLESYDTINKYIRRIKELKLNSLKMILEAKLTRSIESAGVLKQINQRLKEELKLKKEGTYSDQEIEDLTEIICRDIKLIKAEKNKELKVKEQIIEEIKTVYKLNPIFIDDYEKCPVKTLSKLHAFSAGIWGKAIIHLNMKTDELSNNQIGKLETNVAKLSETLLSEKNAKKYMSGMIKRLKELVESMLINFESNEGELTERFKLKFHSFAIYKFENDMEKKQSEYDKLNNPYTIFCEMESNYKNVIRQRLRLGFNFAGNGIIAGDSLVNAIKNKSLRETNKHKISKVKSISWLNSTNIRLKYFSELVEQVKQNKLQNILNHFDHPKTNIEEWFANFVDEYQPTEVYKKIETTFKSECKEVIRKIESAQDSNEIQEFIKNYTNLNDGINFLTKADDHNLDHFRSKIIQAINNNKNKNFQDLNLCLIKASEEDSIMKKLGCTASCPLCSALCWGTRGHDEDDGESKIHHTSHQPMGLNGVHYNATTELCADSCSSQQPLEIWWHGSSPMPWILFKKRLNSIVGFLELIHKKSSMI